MSVKVESHKQWHMDLTYLGTISKMHASINHSEYTTKASSLSRSSLTETPVYLFFFFYKPHPCCLIFGFLFWFFNMQSSQGVGWFTLAVYRVGKIALLCPHEVHYGHITSLGQQKVSGSDGSHSWAGAGKASACFPHVFSSFCLGFWQRSRYRLHHQSEA